MHRNTIIAICVAFCAVAIAAGWGVAGLSGSPGPTVAVQVTSTGSTSAPQPPPDATQPALSAQDQPTAGATTAAAPTANPSTAAPPIATTEPATPIASTSYVEYTVQKGDLLYTIALKNDVTIEEILAINQIANPESLTVGQVIRIPKK